MEREFDWNNIREWTCFTCGGEFATSKDLPVPSCELCGEPLCPDCRERHALDHFGTDSYMQATARRARKVIP